MFRGVFVEIGAGLAYGLVGIVLMAIGYGAIDLLTPGKLGDLVYVHRNRNAALLVSSGTLAVGIIITAAILTSESELGLATGLGTTFGYGLLGIVLLSLSFLVVDVITPGKLGAIVVDEHPHPAVYVSAATHLAVGAIVAAAIS